MFKLQKKPSALNIKKWDLLTFLQWCGSGMFIPDPESWFLLIPDPRCRILDPNTVTKERGKKKLVMGVKKASDPDPQHCFFALLYPDSESGYGSGFRIRLRIRIQYPVTDPDSESGYGSGFRIRLRIWIQNPVTDSDCESGCGYESRDLTYQWLSCIV